LQFEKGRHWAVDSGKEAQSAVFAVARPPVVDQSSPKCRPALPIRCQQVGTLPNARQIVTASALTTLDLPAFSTIAD